MEIAMGDSTYFWDDLLQFIEEQSVIPIIGQELLTADVNGKTVLLYQHLAQQLAESLNVDRDRLGESFDLNQVACRYLQMPNSRREIVYRRMKSIMSAHALPIPEPIKKLAAIKDFKFFISTTFDAAMESALNENRFSGSPKTESIVYAFNDGKDLNCEIKKLDRPAVYYLFGRASAQPNYVITEEDTLEFIHSLQSEKNRPRFLFDELKNKHLLLMGCNYSDWLARFFIRVVKNERLALACDTEAIITGNTVCKDTCLTLFLGSPLSYGTRVFDCGGAIEFVDELYFRWSRLNPFPDAAKPGPARSRDAGPEMESGAVFLSYASQDFAIVEKAKLALEESGLDVWFDKRGGLEPGDDYDLKVQRNIRKCAVFCPFISQNTQNRPEGFFRREWHYAVDRTKNIDDSIPFILPVVIDDTSECTNLVPEKFSRSHWTRMVDARFPSEFIQKVVQLVRDYRKRELGRL